MKLSVGRKTLAAALERLLQDPAGFHKLHAITLGSIIRHLQAGGVIAVTDEQPRAAHSGPLNNH